MYEIWFIQIVVLAIFNRPYTQNTVDLQFGLFLNQEPGLPRSSAP